MSKPKHTPGPWEIRSDGLGINNKRVKIFDVSTGLEPKREDARLIAAAPEMLEALEKITKWAFDIRGEDSSVDLELSRVIMMQARLAIKKAKGENNE